MTNPPLPSFNKSHLNFQDKVIKHPHQIPRLNLKINGDKILNDPIQPYELYNCLNELEMDKAHGPDLIHNKMIIEGDQPSWDELIRLFNECLRKGQYPMGWNFANIHPIPKPNKLHSNPSNYRPIAVSSCLGRVFEKILAKCLQQYCVQNQIFNNLQRGFQINRNTEDILTAFLNDAHTCRDTKSDFDCTFTDFSKAYDSIWHDGLLYKL